MFLFIDGSVRGLTIHQALQKRLWRERFYSITGNSAILGLRAFRGRDALYSHGMAEPTQNLPERVAARLDQMSAEFDRLSAQLEDPAIVVDHRRVRDLSIKKSALEPVVSAFREWKYLSGQALELRQSIASNADPEFAALAREELPDLESRADSTLQGLKSALVTTEDRKV